MIKINPKYQSLLLEALEELLYKIALQQEDLKGQPLSKRRKELTKKQKEVEVLQHLISVFSRTE